MQPARVFILTLLAMIAFAGNSLLCRLALRQTGIDAASFTSIRIISGAIALWVLLRMQKRTVCNAGNWLSALALFTYAAAFSFAYIGLPAGTGALLLFIAVQLTMIVGGLRRGERFHTRQCIGLALACCGLVLLLLPGLSTPSTRAAVLMLGAGLAWGIYSLRGRGTNDPAAETTGNFLRALPMAVLLSIASLSWTRLDRTGILYAIMSGAITSGGGYIIWYTALAGLKATSAATVQLSVPVLAAIGGILFLGESITLRFLFSSVAVLGGIALVVVEREPAAASAA